MIDNTLIVPNEYAYQSNTIKRALFTYDHVYMFAPDDRDIIPTLLYPTVLGAPNRILPDLIGPIRPLGKMNNYDQVFDQVLKDFKPAIDQGSLVIIQKSAEEIFQDEYGNLDLQKIANQPLDFSNIPNPHLIFNCYRNLIAQTDFIRSIGFGIKPEDKELYKNSWCLEDNTFHLGGIVHNVHEKAQIRNPALTSDTNEYVALLAYAKIGALAKGMAFADMYGLNLFTTDSGYDKIINTLEQNYLNITKNFRDPNIPNDLINLRRLEKIVFSEYLDEDIFERLTAKQILRLRNKAWGKSYERKGLAKENLFKIATESNDLTELKKNIIKEIDLFQKASTELKHELKKLKFKVLMAVAPGGAAALTFNGLAESVFSSPSIQDLMFIGSLAIGKLSIDKVEKTYLEFLDYAQKHRESKRLYGHALINPYKKLV